MLINTNNIVINFLLSYRFNISISQKRFSIHLQFHPCNYQKNIYINKIFNIQIYYPISIAFKNLQLLLN